MNICEICGQDRDVVPHGVVNIAAVPFPSFPYGTLVYKGPDGLWHKCVPGVAIDCADEPSIVETSK